MNQESLTPRDRVNRALRFQRPDRAPRDFAAVPVVWQRLEDHYGVTDRRVVLQRLGVDCRVVSYDSFCRHPDVEAKQVDMAASLERSSTDDMWRVWEADGTNRDIWISGARIVNGSWTTLDGMNTSHPTRWRQRRRSKTCGAIAGPPRIGGTSTLCDRSLKR